MELIKMEQKEEITRRHFGQICGPGNVPKGAEGS